MHSFRDGRGVADDDIDARADADLAANARAAGDGEKIEFRGRADYDAAIALSDKYAPEHLEVQTWRNDYYLARLRNYGSLFVGEESTVAYGDKVVGTNHTLPTGRASRYTGGLWVGKFLKTVTCQKLTEEASRRIAPVIGRMCAAECMLAHEITANVRVERNAQRRVGQTEC